MRKVTTAILDACEMGIASWEEVARACLNTMSEDEVADMNDSEGLVAIDEPDDEDDDDAEE